MFLEDNPRQERVGGRSVSYHSDDYQDSQRMSMDLINGITGVPPMSSDRSHAGPGTMPSA